MKSSVFAFLFAILLFLNGCATYQGPTENVNTNALQQNLTTFDSWQLRGRLAFKSEDEKFSANLNWDQQKSVYRVKLTTFIGTSLLEMQGGPGFAQIHADDQEFEDTDAERLIRRITGWNIPIDKLPLWIKGQVNKGDKAEFDEQGLVKSLTTKCLFCDRWQINFERYKQLDQIWLPHQVTLINQDVPENQIKIRINKWTKT